jgi:hypothetical protein
MQRLRMIAGLILLLLLASCASYEGRGLKPGQSGREEVLRLMGAPALQWHEADGGSRLAYPRGPMGLHTYMVSIDAQGRLQGIENVLTVEHFARVEAGMRPEEVLRLLGPVDPARGTTYFAARDELVWEWLYCDPWNRRSRFYVLFDGTARTVRSTMSVDDLECERSMIGCWCGH